MKSVFVLVLLILTSNHAFSETQHVIPQINPGAGERSNKTVGEFPNPMTGIVAERPKAEEAQKKQSDVAKLGPGVTKIEIDLPLDKKTAHTFQKGNFSNMPPTLSTRASVEWLDEEPVSGRHTVKLASSKRVDGIRYYVFQNASVRINFSVHENGDGLTAKELRAVLGKYLVDFNRFN